MLNSHCNNNDKKKLNVQPHLRGFKVHFPLGTESTANNRCVNRAKISAVSVNNGAFFQCCSVVY